MPESPGRVCLQSFSCPPSGVTDTHRRLCSAWRGVWQFKLRSLYFQGKRALPAKLSPLAFSRPCQHPRCTTSIQSRSPERRASQAAVLFSSILYSTYPHPSPPLPWSSWLCSVILQDRIPQSSACPAPLCVSHSVLHPSPGAECPVKLAGREGGICIPLPGAVQISPAILLTNSYQRCPWRTLWRLCSLLLALNRLGLHSAWLVHTDS